MIWDQTLRKRKTFCEKILFITESTQRKVAHTVPRCESKTLSDYRLVTHGCRWMIAVSWNLGAVFDWMLYSCWVEVENWMIGSHEMDSQRCRLPMAENLAAFWINLRKAIPHNSSILTQINSGKMFHKFAARRGLHRRSQGTLWLKRLIWECQKRLQCVVIPVCRNSHLWHVLWEQCNLIISKINESLLYPDHQQITHVAINYFPIVKNLTRIWILHFHSFTHNYAHRIF